MYQFTGCPCSVCGKTLTDTDDIVVCPDCGAPYHRACYQAQGACVYAGKHGTGFEWTPPRLGTARAQVPQLRCAQPGIRPAVQPLRLCVWQRAGRSPAPGGRQPPGPAAGGGFNYTRLYQEAQAGGYWQASAASADEPIDGHPSDEWATYLGPSSPAYLRDFSQMQKYGRKSSICFSALLFGPLYFFYRKAWKPAFVFLAVDLLLQLPSLLELLVLSESAFAPAISGSTLLFLAQIASIASFAVMVLSGCSPSISTAASPPSGSAASRRSFPTNPSARPCCGHRAASAGPPWWASAPLWWCWGLCSACCWAPTCKLSWGWCCETRRPTM